MTEKREAKIIRGYVILLIAATATVVALTPSVHEPLISFWHAVRETLI